MKKITTIKILTIAITLFATLQGITQNGGWIYEDTLLSARRFCTGSELNGKVYIIGGGFFFSPPDSSMLTSFDPKTGVEDNSLADPPVDIYHASSSAVNGKIYVFGGRSWNTSGPLNSVYEYDPATDVWTSKSDMPTARYQLRTAVIDNKIYAIGGQHGSYPNSPEKTVEMYDPVTDTWTTKADMLTGRAYFSADVVDGKIYVMGGQLHGSGFSFSSVEVYDPVADTWTELDSMPATRSWHGSGVINDQIYVFGGGTDAGYPTWKFDPETGSWTDVMAEMSRFTGAFADAVAEDSDGNTCLYALSGAGPDLIPSPWVFKYCPGISSAWDIVNEVIQFQNYPNPFNDFTTIQYELKTAADVSIEIFDLAGQQVATVFEGFQPAGEHRIEWSAEHVPAGVYFYTLRTGEFVATGKLIISK